MNKVVLFTGYGVIMVFCVVIALFVIAQPAAGAISDRSTNVLAGIGVGIAGCILFKDLLGLVQARRAAGAETDALR